MPTMSDLISGFFLAILGSFFGYCMQILIQGQQIEENRRNLELQFKNQSQHLILQLYINERKESLEKLWEIANSDISYNELKQELQLFIKSKMGSYLPQELQGNINSIISQTDYKIYEIEVRYGGRLSIEDEEAMYGDMEELFEEMDRYRQPWEIMDDEVGHEIDAFKRDLQELLRKSLATPSVRS